MTLLIALEVYTLAREIFLLDVGHRSEDFVVIGVCESYWLDSGGEIRLEVIIKIDKGSSTSRICHNGDILSRTALIDKVFPNIHAMGTMTFRAEFLIA